MGPSSTLLIDKSAHEPEWAATARHGLRPAPDGLALVQDFLNTRAVVGSGIDLLENAIHANAWAVAAMGAWTGRRGFAAQPPTLSEHDAAELRRLRDFLGDVMDGRGPELRLRTPSDAQIVTTRTGDMHWVPAGSGWQWVQSAVVGEILLSRHAMTWRRMKQCRKADCRVTLYDRTWDNRAVWHDRSTCDPSFGDPYPFHRV